MRYRLLLVVCVLMGAIACINNEDHTQTEENETLSLRVTIPNYKDIYGGLYPIAWNENDCISVNGVLSQGIEIDEKAANCATFSFGQMELSAPYKISYPTSIERGIVQFSPEQVIADIETFPQGLPMCGYSQEGGSDITMSHLASVICLNIASTKGGIVLNSIRLESEESVSGEFEFDYKKGTLSPANQTSKSATYRFADGYSLSEGDSNLIYLVVPASKLGDCTFTLYATNGAHMTVEWQDINAQAGRVIGSEQFTFIEDGYAQLEGMKREDDTIIQRYPTITGYVLDSDGNPIEGVSVSDGFSVVATDSEGYYSIKIVQDAWYIYISVPSEYKIPINKDGQPCFFKRYPSQSSRYDFTLERLEGGKESEFMLFAFADPQTGKLSSVNRFSKQVAPEVKRYSASLGVPCYGITLGDVISMGSSDISQTVLPAMREAMHAERMGMPVFQIMGNHDNCFMSATRPVEGRTIRDINLNIQRMFEEAFGPINYSFNRGDAHIVGMRNV
ncbi:MAG: hypothetical protein IIV24_03040, partial [Alistipes sp.]|nr:hypothetical protein [Alistipes sp.]